MNPTIHKTPLYGHIASDGIAHVSFGVGFDDVPFDSIEGAEGEWFGKWDAIDERLIDELPTTDTGLRIGTFYWTDEGHWRAEIMEPDEALEKRLVRPDN